MWICMYSYWAKPSVKFRALDHSLFNEKSCNSTELKLKFYLLDLDDFMFMPILKIGLVLVL